jgi:hypothetical protein
VTQKVQPTDPNYSQWSLFLFPRDPSSPPLPMTPSLFECPFPGCGLSYRRKEHLTRHAKLHSKPQSFECPFCDRSFARSDTLRHHVRSYHPDKELTSSRASRACNYCRTRRSKCNGNDPCNRCVRLGKKCFYSERSQRELVWSRMSSLIVRSEGLETSPCNVAPCVQAYFDNFHSEWPFLHPATFDHTREPAFLLQSVTMMGMWVTMERSAQDRAKELHKKLISCIYEQKVNYQSLASTLNNINASQCRITGLYQRIMQLGKVRTSASLILLLGL